MSNSGLSNDEKCLDAFAGLSNGKKLYNSGFFNLFSFKLKASFLNGNFSTVLLLDKLLLIGSIVNDLIVVSVSSLNLNQINQLGQTNQIQINQDATSHITLALTEFLSKTSNKINRIQINRAVQVTNRVDLDGMRKSTMS